MWNLSDKSNRIRTNDLKGTLASQRTLVENSKKFLVKCPLFYLTDCCPFLLIIFILNFKLILE